VGAMTNSRVAIGSYDTYDALIGWGTNWTKTTLADAAADAAESFFDEYTKSVSRVDILSHTFAIFQKVTFCWGCLHCADL